MKRIESMQYSLLNEHKAFCEVQNSDASEIVLFLLFFFANVSMVCVFPLCKTLIKNINNGAYRGGQKACR